MSVFLEIVIDAGVLAGTGVSSRDEIEDPLVEALATAGTAEVTGGGGGSGRYNIDVEVPNDDDLDDVIQIIRSVLQRYKVPNTTTINQYEPTARTFSVY
jgi:hypothetical protein